MYDMEDVKRESEERMENLRRFSERMWEGWEKTFKTEGKD